MRRTFMGSLVGVALAVVFAAPAAAGTNSDSRYFERGRTAVAFDGDCRLTPDEERFVCVELQVQAFQGRRGGSEPASRFSGEELCFSRFRTSSDADTGDPIRQTIEEGCAANRPDLSVSFGDQLTSASVSGVVRVHRERCTFSGKDGTCESDTRQVPVDLTWTADRPVVETFVYIRQNDQDCEINLTVNERTRRARVRGTIGAGDVRMRGAITRRDLQQTQVCS